MAVAAQQSGITSAVQELAGELLPRTRRACAAGWPTICTRRSPSSARTRTTSCARSSSAAPRPTSARCCGCWRTARAPTTWSSRTRRWSSSAATCAAAFRWPRCCAPTGSATRGCGSAGRQRSRSASTTPASSPPGRIRARPSCSPTSTRSPTSSCEEFGTERERMMRSASQVRAETVRAILAGEPIDEEVASRRLGYELGRHHLALRVASAGSEIRGLERAVDEAAAALGVGAAARPRVGRGAIRRLVRVVRRPGNRGARALRAATRSARRVRHTGPGSRGVPQVARRGASGRAHRVARRRARR